MKQEEILPMLARIGAIKRGLFALAKRNPDGTWNLSDTYVDKRVLSNGQHEEEMSAVCLLFAEELVKHDISVVIGPAEGGKPFAVKTAEHMTRLTGRKVDYVFAEKGKGEAEGGFVLHPRDAKLVANRRVAVTEDILTSGDSAKRVVGLLRMLGANVVAVCAICNRGGVTAQKVGDPAVLYALTSISLQVWPHPTCPLYGKVPVNTDVGHGAEFLREMAQNAQEKS